MLALGLELQFHTDKETPWSPVLDSSHTSCCHLISTALLSPEQTLAHCMSIPFPLLHFAGPRASSLGSQQAISKKPY